MEGEHTYPSYIGLIESGEFDKRVSAALSILESCRLCPRECSVNRMQGEIGACGIGRLATVCSAHPHFGEERPLVGRRGSGTIFLSGCNLKCIFCQNYDISHGLSGKEVTAGQLASMMLGLLLLSRREKIGAFSMENMTFGIFSWIRSWMALRFFVFKLRF